MKNNIDQSPFFLIEDHTINCYDKNGESLPGDFSGVIYDNSDQKFWLFSRFDNERNFHILESNDYNAAKVEALKKFNFASI